MRSFVALSLVVGCFIFTGCERATRVPLSSTAGAPILLFNGLGASQHDVAAIEGILARNHWAYSTADASELGEMSRARLGQYRLLIIPGGNFIDMNSALGPRTLANVHDAVQEGLGYLGICAGGFLAGKFAGNGLDLASGAQFKFYSAEERGVRKAAVAITSPGAAPLEQYWEDGPQFSGWGAVAGRYPDGSPAIVEGNSGKGWVILSGVHPEAPQSWRHGLEFTTPVSTSNAYAATLIDAALNRRWLAHD